MFARLLNILCAVVTAGALPLYASGEPSTANAGGLDVLDALVGRWMDVRAAIAAESREWRDQQAAWEREIELLERESAWLEQELSGNRRWLHAQEAEQAAQRSRNDAMAKALTRLGEAFERAETDLTRWESMIPDGLRLMAGETVSLPDGVPQPEAETRISHRGYRVVARYTRLENLHQSIHVSRQLLDTVHGQSRQVDVVFFGLAQAWAVSPNRDWAAVGVPSTTGWQWRPAPEHAGAMGLAVEILQRERTAQWIHGPLRPVWEPTP